MSKILTKKKVIASRFAAFLLMMIILLSAVFSAAAEDGGSEMTTNTTTHDVAIVFDNSRSMYADTDRWSQALYAIGVFASMLDYDAGDKLGIYPMEAISVGKGGAMISDRMEITKNNIQDISRIYCDETAPTIFRPSYIARDYLKNSDADEKWLIIMTDGEFFYDKGDPSEEFRQKSAQWLKKRVESLIYNISVKDAEDEEYGDAEKNAPLLYEDINVQYLGFGDATKLSSERPNVYTANVGSASNLAPELVEICNKIFKRNKVDNISNGKFTIDVSMKNIVAFAQGSGAEIKSLQNSDGQNVDVAIDERIKAGYEGTGDADINSSDENRRYTPVIADVTGQVVTYSDCQSGTYNLSYTGSDVEVYYEPDVRIDAYLTDQNGEKLDLSKSVEPGKYKLNYSMIDSKTGEDVSDCKELNPINYYSELTTDGETRRIESGEDVELTDSAETTLSVKAEFLDKYTVKKDFAIDVKLPDEDALKVRIKGDGTLHKPDKEKWKPFKVEITKNNAPLSDEELAAMKTTFTFSDGSPARVTLRSGESAYDVEYAKNEDGSFVDEIQSGNVELNVTATSTDRFDREITGSATHRFKVSDWSAWIFPLIIALIILSFLALLAFILTRKALPNGVDMNDSSNILVGGKEKKITPNAPDYSTKGIFKSTGTLTVDMPSVQVSTGVKGRCNATFELKAVDPIIKRSATRRMEVVAINSTCDYIIINSREFEKKDGVISFAEKKPPLILDNTTITLGKNIRVADRIKKKLEMEYKITRV